MGRLEPCPLRRLRRFRPPKRGIGAACAGAVLAVEQALEDRSAFERGPEAVDSESRDDGNREDSRRRVPGGQVPSDRKDVENPPREVPDHERHEGVANQDDDAASEEDDEEACIDQECSD